MMLECQSFADRVAEPSAADPAALYDSTHGLESAILGVRPEGRAQFCFEERRLRQSFGHFRPRLPYCALLAPVVVWAFPEAPCYRQRSELAFGIGTTLPVVLSYEVIVRPDGGKYPGFDTHGGRAKDEPRRTLQFTKPVENHRTQGVCSSTRRRTGLFARQVLPGCVINTPTGVRLARHIGVHLHDHHVMMRQCRRPGYQPTALQC